ncbi:DUF2225 domain-containing protein [bacterium C-53]|nr:DUF2225 domain-containing protein [Lachnospiraceae bacterium]NBI02524.1 DUF2225 domain-containing protein [Lachnospiraceae bacterium]RKJ11615.1 DUF2225 domain-containing protein [bacterium C-53]
MGILAGLEGFGLGNLENSDIFAEEAEEKAKKKAEAVHQTTEEELVFEKSYKCPVCDKDFHSKTVKMGKAKLLGTDLDLRPKHETIDSLKYDVILCPNCGYAALSRYFQYIAAPQAKLIKANISSKFQNNPPKGDIYTYDEAIERYKLALANAVVKRARSSEKAYICLKMAWVVRGKAENLDANDPQYEALKKACLEEEDELLKNALEGFLAARQSEAFPMCGMDESTVDYLISVMSLRFGQLDVAAKLVSNLIVSPSTNKRMKDKARDLKDMIVEKVKKQGSAK